jgi:hypothetical protein
MPTCFRVSQSKSVHHRLLNTDPNPNPNLPALKPTNTTCLGLTNVRSYAIFKDLRKDKFLIGLWEHILYRGPPIPLPQSYKILYQLLD